MWGFLQYNDIYFLFIKGIPAAVICSFEQHYHTDIMILNALNAMVLKVKILFLVNPSA